MSKSLKRAEEIYELQNPRVKEISLVDNPAVPKAKILLIKDASAGSGGVFSSPVLLIDEKLSEFLCVLKDSGDGEKLSESTRKSLIGAAASVGSAIDAAKRFDTILKEDYEYSEKDDTWLMSDLNYIAGMLLNCRGILDYAREKVKSENGGELVTACQGHILEALDSTAKLLTSVVSDVKSKMPMMEEDGMAVMTKDDPPKDAMAQMMEMLGAISEKLSGFDSRLTTIETMASKIEPAGSQETLVDEPASAEEAELLTIEEIEEVMTLLNEGTLTNEQRESFLAALEAQEAIAV